MSDALPTGFSAKTQARGQLFQTSAVYETELQRNTAAMPKPAQIIKQYLMTINPLKSPGNWLNQYLEVFFYACALMFVISITKHGSLLNLIIFSLVFYIMANLVNTFWYHRYCSHRAFRFSRNWIPKVLLWMNPVAYREEAYVFNHLLHHKFSDTPQDPYGPHLGWLGNFLASPFFKVDTGVSLADFEHMKMLLKHTGITFASYENFKKWGSVEHPLVFLIRSTFATVFWFGSVYLIGGIELMCIWGAILFAFHAVARDFNYRGHGGGSKAPKHKADLDFFRESKALNQWFYGFSAGEWHNNHHAFQLSANAGFLKWQLDVPFLAVKLLKKLKVVTRYNDSTDAFNRKYLK